MPTQRLDIGRSALRTRNHLIISVQNYCDIKSKETGECAWSSIVKQFRYGKAKK